MSDAFKPGRPLLLQISEERAISTVAGETFVDIGPDAIAQARMRAPSWIVAEVEVLTYRQLVRRTPGELTLVREIVGRVVSGDISAEMAAEHSLPRLSLADAEFYPATHV